MSVSDILTASRRKSLLGIVGSKFWFLPPPAFCDIHRSDPSNLTAPCRATTKCAVARSGPKVSWRSGTNLVNKTYITHTHTHTHTHIECINIIVNWINWMPLDFPSLSVPNLCILSAKAKSFQVLLDTIRDQVFLGQHRCFIPSIFNIIQCSTESASTLHSMYTNHLNLSFLIA